MNLTGEPVLGRFCHRVSLVNVTDDFERISAWREARLSHAPLIHTGLVDDGRRVGQKRRGGS